MLQKFILLLITITIATLSGCASSRDLAHIQKNMEVDAHFRLAKMDPGFRYYYNGPQGEPTALLALDEQYRLSSEFWHEFSGDDVQLQKWMKEFRRLRGDWDDLAYLTIDYEGSEILDHNRERIGLIYSRYDFIVAWWGAGNEIIVSQPEPGSIRFSPFFRMRSHH